MTTTVDVDDNVVSSFPHTLILAGVLVVALLVSDAHNLLIFRFGIRGKLLHLAACGLYLLTTDCCFGSGLGGLRARRRRSQGTKQPPTHTTHSRARAFIKGLGVSCSRSLTVRGRCWLVGWVHRTLREFYGTLLVGSTSNEGDFRRRVHVGKK